MKKSQNLKETILLEEMFLDQLEFKLKSVLELYDFSRINKSEVASFLSRLAEITNENVEILNKYYDREKGY